MVAKAKIIATGSYLPRKILTNQDLEKMVDTSDDWIVTRTGMKERRIADVNEYTSDMGLAAAKVAITEAGLSATDIDFIIFATITPDYPFPSTACLIQHQLGAKNCGSVDIQATCTGFLYALSMAKAYIESGLCKNILVVAAEKLSSITDYKDRSTCVLFGDGASACIVSGEAPKGGLVIDSIQVGSDGEFAHLIYQPGGGCRAPASVETVSASQHYIKMSGKEVFKHAVRHMEAACKKCLEDAGVTENEISWVIPHQANVRIIDAMAKRFEHLPENKIYRTVHKYGNTSASSIGIALDEMQKTQKLQEGEKILLTAFGGGLVWGAALLRREG